MSTNNITTGNCSNYNGFFAKVRSPGVLLVRVNPVISLKLSFIVNLISDVFNSMCSFVYLNLPMDKSRGFRQQSQTACDRGVVVGRFYRTRGSFRAHLVDSNRQHLHKTHTIPRHAKLGTCAPSRLYDICFGRGLSDNLLRNSIAQEGNYVQSRSLTP